MSCRYLRIRGVVQGVGYRAWAKRLAEQLNITGYVRNMEDGSVEIVACGSESSLNVFVNACKRGPAAAVVSDVEMTDTTFRDEGRFEIWL